jgi:hypothetical protein
MSNTYKPTTSRLEALRSAWRDVEAANAAFALVDRKDVSQLDAAWVKVLMAEVKYDGILMRCD